LLDKTVLAFQCQAGAVDQGQLTIKAAKQLIEIAGKQADVQAFLVSTFGGKGELDLAIVTGDLPALQQVIALVIKTHRTDLDQLAIKPETVFRLAGFIDTA